MSGIPLSLGLGFRAGGGGGASTLVSASMRTMVSQESVSTTSVGRVITTGEWFYTRYRDHSVKSVTGLRGVYWNGIVWNGAPTTLNRQKEIGQVGHAIRGAFVSGPTSDGADTGGTASVMTWTDVEGNSSVGTQAGVDQFIYEHSPITNTIAARTFAQFEAAGGSVSASTVGGVSTASTRIFVPPSWIVIADAGIDVDALDPYYVQLEEQATLAVTAASVTAFAGYAEITFPSTPSAGWKPGALVSPTGATGNTTINGTAIVTNVTGNVVTIERSNITTGAVGGTVVVRPFLPHGVIQSITQTDLPFGDRYVPRVSEEDIIGDADWSTIATGAEGGRANGFMMMLGTDAAGGKNVLVQGDSILAYTDDTASNGSGGLKGDAYGGLSYGTRALNAAGYPHFKIAVPSMNAKWDVINGTDKVRQWIAGFCSAMISNMGSNDATEMGTYVPTLNSTFAAAMRDDAVVIQCTITPRSTNGSSVNWSLSPRTLQGAGSAPWTPSTGAVYTTYNPDIIAGNWNNDGHIDVAAIVGDLDGTATVDGYWPVDGVNEYKYTADGVHPSRDGYAAIAAHADFNSSALATLFGF